MLASEVLRDLHHEPGQSWLPLPRRWRCLWLRELRPILRAGECRRAHGRRTFAVHDVSEATGSGVGLVQEPQQPGFSKCGLAFGQKNAHCPKKRVDE